MLLILLINYSNYLNLFICQDGWDDSAVSELVSSSALLLSSLELSDTQFYEP